MKTHGDIEFRNCVFGYEPNKPIIKNFSAKISAGQKVAIVGPTGAGKTTVVSLLMRFYELDGGQILIDGIPTTDLTREQVHENFCMVLQDTWLFDGTIYENLSFGLENVNKAQVMNACQVAGIDHLINMLPKGLDTVLDAKTVFSAGEAQLLTIARAVLRDAPILILDEATSNVDTRTEQKVQAAMDKLCAHSRTAFIIAHRLSTIRNADVILVMNDGDIVEQGTHDQLLAKNGKYAELYNSQFASV
jgi:ATP-binding cassette subfamily B protein